jgi:hypothetical protein
MHAVLALALLTTAPTADVLAGPDSNQYAPALRRFIAECPELTPECKTRLERLRSRMSLPTLERK